MTTSEKKETKEKILEVARRLFSQNGFSGTSVRLIAEKSGVNIGAVNYHFGSKENLFWSVINEAFDWIESGTEKVAADSEDLEQLARKLFQFLRSSSHYVVSTMKTFLSDAVPPPEMNHPYTEKLNRETMGPPGGRFIVAFLKKRHPQAQDEALNWVVMCLFSSIFHFATMCCSSHFENAKSEALSDEQIEENLSKMAQALVLYMKETKNWPTSSK